MTKQVETSTVSAVANPVEEIRQVLYRYCRGMDRMDRELATSCFSPGAEVEYVGIHTGTAVSFLDFVWDSHRTMAGHSHQITNVLVELDGDRAVSEAYVTVALWPRPDPDPIERTVRGRYLDAWSCRNGRWSIDRRVYLTDLRSVTPLPADPLGPYVGTSARDRTDRSYGFLSSADRSAPTEVAAVGTGRKGLKIFRGSEAPELSASGIGEHPDAATPEIVEKLRDSGVAQGVVGSVPFRHDGPDGFSLVSIYFKPNYHSTRHSHNADCLYYIKSGEARLGNQTLKAGDGFFVPANSPYQFQAGPEGFELLEFRHATSYDQRLWDEDLERWQPVFAAAEENRDLWATLDGPSGDRR